ncbi:MAG: hypothetical protein SOZ83_04155 [Sphaerochaetaceae bacterium]|nr:hypothetical protein [Sphaerochaetaceae bacterium]
MRKFSISIFVLSVIVLDVFSLSLDEVIARAKRESSVYRDSLNSAKKSDYSLELLSLDKEHTFSFGVNNGSWTDKSNERDNTSNAGSSSVSFSPYFTYTNAEDNSTSLSFAVPVKLNYVSAGITENSTYTPSVSLDQKILLNGVKDNRLELQKQLARVETRSLNEKTELQFENTMYNAISNVMSRESTLLNATSSYDEKRTQFDSDVALGLIKEGTYAYKKDEAVLISLLSSKTRAEDLFLSAKEEFERVSGFPWVDIDTIDEIEIDFKERQDGNSTIQSAKINMDTAQNEYDILMNNDDRILTLNANASTEIKGSALSYSDFGGGINYRDNSWNVGVKASGKFEDSNNWKGTPTVNFSLGYTLGTTVDETKRLKQQTALLNLQNKTYEYNNALLNYKTSVLNMMNSISAKTDDVRQAHLLFENAKLDYENSLSLNEKGYYTPLTFKKEEINYKVAENSYKTSLLSLYILNNESKILNI